MKRGSKIEDRGWQSDHPIGAIFHPPFSFLGSGITGRCLLKLGKLRVELWRVPHGSGIPAHVHRHVSSRFIFLDRNLCVRRAGSWRNRALPWLRWYHVRPGQVHHALADRGPARFLNVEWWNPATRDGIHSAPQSAAEDFHPL